MAPGSNHVSEELSQINHNIEELKAQIYERIDKHFRQYASIFDGDDGFGQELACLRKTIEGFKSTIENDDFEKVSQYQAEVLHARTQMSITDDLVEVLHALSKIDDTLLEHDKYLESGDFSEAAVSLMTAEKHLADERLKQKEYCDATIVAILRRDYQEKRAHLRSRIEDMWRKAVVWQRHTFGQQYAASLQITSSLNGMQSDVDITEIVDALDRLNLLDTHMQRLVTLLMEKFLEPMCKQHFLQPSTHHTSHTHTLTLDGQRKPVSTRSQRNKKRLAQEEAVTKHLLAKAVPLHVDDAEMHEKIISSVAQLEGFMENVGFSIDTSQGPFTSYVQRVRLHDQNRRRQDILARARSLMLMDNFNTIRVEHATERGGLFPSSQSGGGSANIVNSAFFWALAHLVSFCTVFEGDTPELRESIYRLPSCCVTETTKKVMDLLYMTLDECREADQATSVQLFFTVRDVLDLFRAVVPTYHAKALDSAPQLAATLYNDCMYIAHHLLSLGYIYRDSLPEEFRSLATFVDMVPPFRSLGQQQLERMIQKQMSGIHACLDICQGFRDTTEPELFAAVERGLKQVLHQLAVFTKTCKQMQNVMASSVFNACLGTLISSVIARVLRDILGLKDISEDECRNLEQFTTSLIEELEGHWRSAAVIEPGDTEIGSGAIYDSEDLLSKNISNWEKVVQLREILSDKLVVIGTKFEEGHWVFSPEELRSLIKAIFADSSRRQQIPDQKKLKAL
eukprot:gene9001-1331_t